MLFLGDSRFFWSENIGNFIHLPSTWDSILNTGIGMPDSGTLWITSYLNFTSLFTKFGLSWDMITLIFWVLPIFAISFLSAFFLFKQVFKSSLFAIISGIIYSLNTYT